MKETSSRLIDSPKTYVLLIVLIVSAIYIQTFYFELIFLDDDTLVYTRFDDTELVEKVNTAFTSNYLGGHYYRPVTLLTFIIENAIGGESLFLYHFSNFIIHLLSCLFLFFVLLQLNYQTLVSFFAALFFSLNPIHINAVGWIAGRGDLLAGFFTITAFYIFLKFIISNKSILIIPVSFLLLFAILSKEVALIVPFLFLVFYFIEKKDYTLNKNNVAVLLLFLSVTGVYYFLRGAVLTDVHLTKFSFTTFIRNFLVLPETISKAFVPTGIKALPGIDMFTSVVGIVILVVLIFIPFKMKIINKSLYYFGLVWFVSLMLPGMVFRTMEQDGFFYWDCRSYLPLIGLVFMTVEILRGTYLGGHKKKCFEFFAVYLLILALFTFSKVGYYRNPLIYWHFVKIDYPDRYLPYIGLFNYYNYSGELKNAESELQGAIKINPSEFIIRQLLLNFYLKNNEKPKAFLVVKEAMQTKDIDISFFVESFIVLSLELARFDELDYLIEKSSVDKNSFEKIRTVIIQKLNELRDDSDKTRLKELLDKINKRNA